MNDEQLMIIYDQLSLSREVVGEFECTETS